MKIIYKENTLDLHFGTRLFTILEDITGESWAIMDYTKIKMQKFCFYAAIISTLQYNKIDPHFLWEDFENWLDDNGGLTLLTEFNKWFSEHMQPMYDKIEQELTPEQREEIEKKMTEIVKAKH